MSVPAGPLKELSLIDETIEPDKIDPGSTSAARRENTRTWIAFGLLFMLAAVAAAWILIALFTDISGDDPVGPALDKIFAGVLALTGTAVGFYFGAASEKAI